MIVDFSQFAGKTLILYNDAPAAFPARVPSYDYYTGAPDLSPNGAPAILPGYGPNTRTIMQVKIAAIAPAPAFNLTALTAAFTHNADGSGVFESGQHPIIVGQAAYNSAYGTSFAASSNCNAPGSTSQRCDGLVRINDTSSPSASTRSSGQATKMTDAAAAQGDPRRDELDDLRRVRPDAGQPRRRGPAAHARRAERHALPVRQPGDGAHRRHQPAEGRRQRHARSRARRTARRSGGSRTTAWTRTRSTSTCTTCSCSTGSPGTTSSSRPTPTSSAGRTPSGSARSRTRSSPCGRSSRRCRSRSRTPSDMLNPMMPAAIDGDVQQRRPAGQPDGPIVNQLVNFGWEYVYHCHILSHEEMDMMRPVSVALPPNAADGARRSRSPGAATTADRGHLERQLDHRDVVPGPADHERDHVDRCRDGDVAARPGRTPTAPRSFTDPTANASHGVPLPGRRPEHGRLRRRRSRA